MASASSLQSKKSGGKPPAKVRYDAEYGRRMEQVKQSGADRLDRRLKRLHYTFERYHQSLPRENIIRYEDICATGGKALQIITPAAAQLDEPLENKNANPLYDRDRILRVGERLLESEGAYWNFYEKRDVEEILDNFR